MDDDIPIVATSKHVVVNTITAADDYLKMIQPSPQAVPVYETNTYYSTLEFSKTINDDETSKVINTQDVVTQVIVTESLPHGRMPMSMSHDLEHGSHELSPSTHDNDDEVINDNDDDVDEYSEEEAEIHHHKHNNNKGNNYIKKTNILDINPTRIDQHPNAGTAMPLHLYATKTYLTTFTYFTTLLQNAAHVGGEISSTIVDSHTRVIENVITESVAPSLIPTEILNKISKTIIDDSKSDLKTRIRLKNGQKIEVTAANILRPVDYATETKVVSSVETNDLDVAANDLSPVALAHDNGENIVVETSSEDVIELPQQEPIKLPTINPKPKPSSGSLKIPSILNSISMPTLPSFSALGPVINAMAGILQSNFGTQTANKVLPVIVQNVPAKSKPEHETLPQPLPLFSQESQDTILSQTESKNKVPLYIPIHPNGQHHHAAIMGSGIAISPGDVITANSDVIVGRPAVIGPKLPPKMSNKPEEIQGMEAPPPFVPLKTPQRSSSFVKDIKSNGNINQVVIKKGDDYIGPVPPKDTPVTVQNKPIPLNGFPRPSAPQNLQKIQPIIPPMMRPQQGHDQHRPGNILISKPNLANSHENPHFVKINHQQPTHKIVPIRSAPEHPKIIPHVHHGHHHHHHQNKQQVNHHLHHSHSHNNNNHHHHHYHQQQPPPPQNGIQPSIIEIQKIPEVYSTDLPIITVNNQHKFQGNRISSINHANNVIHELPEILDKPVNGQPLLVDIQPSQVANVVIPHDSSSSVLVFGGVHEAHKAGQYFNDPPPHANAEIGIKSVNLLADINGNKYESNKQHNLQPAVHYDVKDNIIVASENIGAPSNINLQVSPLTISPSVSISHRPLHQFSANSIHSINFSPSSVISFYPEASDIFRRPPSPPSPSTQQQILNQQKQQQIAIEQQLKQKQIENQMRAEIENQKRQEYIQHQKNTEMQKRKEYEEQQRRKEQEELQRRKEYEEQQRRKEYEQEQRRKEYEEQQQKRKEFEEQQRQKQIELQRKQEYERQQQQKRQQEIENQKRLQQQHELKNRIKNQIVLPHRSPNRPEIPHAPIQNTQNNQQHQNGGFIVLSSNYNSHPQATPSQQSPFIPMPSFNIPFSSSSTPSPPIVVQNTPSNDVFESEIDGQEQESVNRPKLPSGENHGSLEDDEVKDIEDFDNFVYHRITGSTTESTATAHSTSTSTTRRISTIPISTEKISITTSRNGPMYIPRPYPNHQFENLPVLVNDLQHRPSSSRPTVKPFQPLPAIRPHGKPNTISQSLKPPMIMPPKISRRPTHPFGAHKTTFKISMPIDPMPDDESVVNNLQTEIPFNPIYTQSMSSAITTSTSSTTSSPIIIKSESSTSSSISSSSSSPSYTTPRISLEFSTERRESSTAKRADLNIGEIERNKEKKGEIFDNKETVYHGYEKNNNNRAKDDFDLMPPSNKHEKPYQTIHRDLTTYKSTNVKLEVSATELETMRPPPPTPTTKAPSFDDIVNMKPPAPTHEPNKPQYVNIKRPSISLNKFTPSHPDPMLTTTIRSKTTATTFRPPFRKYSTTLKPIEEKKEVEMEKDEGVKINLNATPVLAIDDRTSVINTLPSPHTSTSVESSIRKESSVVRIPNTDIKRFQNRTKINVEQIVTSTRWVHVTNTKTITLSKTKTEVINRSHGVPIKSTSVHTVYETITETETLLKPTVITTIQPTKTIIRETIIPSYTASTTTEEIVEGFVSHEDLDEFIINYDNEKNDGSITKVNSKENVSSSKRPVDNDSILVVVTDKKNQHKINLDPSIITPSLYNHSTFSNEIEDVSRGEEDSNDGAGHILLGGILIATPPHLNKSHQGATSSSGNRCFPECNKANNEYCHRVDGHLRCDCRPGFARMFVDRPCKRKFVQLITT